MYVCLIEDMIIGVSQLPILTEEWTAAVEWAANMPAGGRIGGCLSVANDLSIESAVCDLVCYHIIDLEKVVLDRIVEG